MGGQFNKWWLLPFGILTTSALIASSIIIFGPTFADRSFDEVALHGAHKPTETSGSIPECSDASANNDHGCYEQRYGNLVRVSGVEAAFAQLKDEFTEDEFVNTNCHHLTHIIGRAATELYSDVTGAYSRGDNFCASGYYHGVIEATMATLGADEVLDEADNICAEVRESQSQSFDHRNCLHGLGHGSMYVLGNELFEALRVCDALEDEWEKDQCSGGVFMENLNTDENSGHTSNHLKPDQAFYSCTEVKRPSTKLSATCGTPNTL